MSSAPIHPRLQSIAPFHIGTVAKWPEISQPSAYSDTALRHFSSLTPERIFKAAMLCPQPGTFNWTDADAFVEFCDTRGKRLHGHTLIWDRELPAWMSEAGSNPLLLQQHISAVVSRYQKKVQAWDVVNEAFSEQGQLREGTWFGIGGEDYLEAAFRSAAEADPSALLFYNDFDIEVNPVKRKGILDHLNALRDKGVRIDGIGLQLHLNISTARPSEVKMALHDIAAQGYLVHLSELDVSVNPYDGLVSGLEELFRRQASLLTQVVAHYMEIPPAQRYGITFWGVGDADSWLVLDLKLIDYPLLFDEYYGPKPAFFSLLKFFDNEH